MKFLFIFLIMTYVSFASSVKVTCKAKTFTNTLIFNEARDTILIEDCITSQDMVVNEIEPHCQTNLYLYKSDGKWFDEQSYETIVDVVNTTKIAFPSDMDGPGLTWKCKPYKPQKKK